MIVFHRNLATMMFICFFGILGLSTCLTISQADSTIDPVDLTYSTYFGGSSWDAGVDIGTDSANNIIICGNTNSSDFPTTPNAYESNYSDTEDIIVAKFSADCRSLLWSTFFGGADEDYANSMAIDTEGNIILTGRTKSEDFPITPNAYESNYGGGESDSFIAKISSDGQLLWSTYFGGNHTDRGSGIALDGNNNIIVTGHTVSLDLPLENAYQSNNSGVHDAFVAKISADGQSLLWSTYFGGNSSDYGGNVAVDTLNNVLVTGYTYSSDFPVVSAYQDAYGGGGDAFIAKLSADGHSLLWSTYIGGYSIDTAEDGLVIDSAGNIIVHGMTTSGDFPTLNAFQAASRGVDAFVAKYDADGQPLFATFLGGTSNDQGKAVALDSAGNIVLAGFSSSINFPLANASQLDFAGESDAFVARLSANGQSLLFATYLGGLRGDISEGVAVNSLGNVVVTGYTTSRNFPVARDAYQARNEGNHDIFISMYGEATDLKKKDGSSPGFELVVVAVGLISIAVLSSRIQHNSDQ